MALGDTTSAAKLRQLAAKLEKGKAAIAFSGHFSAGKSSLINSLCGRKLLPSGPIPTSANLVVIENGQEEALVVRDAPDGSEVVLPIPLDELADYCKDGQTNRRIDIRYPSELLGDRLQLLDTPGVDSTDDAHHRATESSLHLADAVFYVTDYNHVLSEMNLALTKRLHEAGKPLYLIVNQVDKHRDEEIAFEEYRRNVKHVFEAWGVRPAGYLFISVKSPGHPLSEWGRLLSLLQELRTQAEDLLRYSVQRSALTVIRECAERLFPVPADAHAEEEAASASQQLTLLEARLAELKQTPERERESMRSDVNKLIDNAPIMPATTRDLAAAYLQSRKPGFKVGFLFGSEGKTKAEAATRLTAFAARLADHVEKELVWHLNSRLGTSFTVEVDSSRLAEQVNEAASFTDEYTMTYCRQVEESIKSAYRRLAISRYNALATEKDAELVTAIAAVKAEITAVQGQLATAQKQLAVSREKEKLIDQFSQLVIQGGQTRSFVLPNPEQLPDVTDGVLQSYAAAAQQAMRLRKHDDSQQQAAAEPAARGETFHYRTVMEHTARDLAQGASLLSDIPALAEVSRTLANRAEKLRRNRFTVALFGAFSAGKSSFASALIGEPVLPVSPNPTTAAINAILPPDEAHPHGTAVIRMKSESALLEDLNYSIAMLGLPDEGLTDVQAAINSLRKLNVDQIPAKGKPHVSFIQAVASGYTQVKEKLGTAWNADFNDYRRYVAEEEKSCFVDAIDLYYRSAFSEQGVVFVDTPGADSIHARHTGVTFDYMKNADAILFVTYYNHAFSQADKQFLLQLGRVKETFILDKMFFIVNAADLADSEEELEGVLAYVQKELLQHGIRKPRMFAVSSREALEAKQQGNEALLYRSGIAAFEHSFARFAEKELAEVTVRSAKQELARAVSRLQSVVVGMRQSGDERALRLQAMQTLSDKLSQSFSHDISTYSMQPVHQELEELLHHVKQRCYYRFGELYTDAFHPSVLQEDGRDIGIALQSAWRTLQQAASVDVSSELLATTLRMEHYVQAKARSWTEAAIARIHGELEGFICDEWEPSKESTPLIEETIDPVTVKEKDIRKLFKSAKSFFEGEGKQALKLVLEEDISRAVNGAVARQGERLDAFYQDRLQALLAHAQLFLQDQLALYIGQFAEATVDTTRIADYEQRLVSLASYLD